MPRRILTLSVLLAALAFAPEAAAQRLSGSITLVDPETGKEADLLKGSEYGACNVSAASYTVSASNQYCRIRLTGGTQAVTVPAPSSAGLTSELLVITSAAAGTKTVTASGTEYTLPAAGEQLVLHAIDGSTWERVPGSGGSSTDDQTLSLTGTTLAIEGGNSVDLASVNTDDQTLSLAGNDLSIEGGNTVTLPGLSCPSGHACAWEDQGDGTQLYVATDNVAPSAPGIAVTELDAQNDLSFTFSEGGTWDLYFQSGAGGPVGDTTAATLLAGGSTSTATYSHTGLANGTTYYYGLVEEDEAGNRSPVATANGTPLAVGTPYDVTDTHGVYAFRSLVSGYAGPVIEAAKIGSPPQDFTATEVTDGTLEAFAAGGFVYVTKWYDQDGTPDDIVVNTAVVTDSTDLMQITGGDGTLRTVNGLPAGLGATAQQNYVLASGTAFDTQSFAALAVYQQTANRQYIFEATGSDLDDLSLRTWDDGRIRFYVSGGSTSVLTADDPAKGDDAQYLAAVQAGVGTQTARQDADNATENTGSISYAATESLGLVFGPSMQALILYTSDAPAGFLGTQNDLVTTYSIP